LLGTHVGRRADHGRLSCAEIEDRSGHVDPFGVGRLGRECFREPEVEELHRAVGADLQVARLEVAVRDPAFVCRFERGRDLPRYLERFPERERPRLQTFGERLALDELEDERLRVVRLLDAVEHRDVRMTEPREQARLALEERLAVRVELVGFGESLERDLSAEALVARAQHLAHAADADEREHLVTAYPRWRRQHSSRL
jgi:hypothetical protein